MTLACLDISFKKRCLYRLFTYQLKAHTISNKLVSKVFAQKKGGKVMTATNICSNFEVSGVVQVTLMLPDVSSKKMKCAH